MLYGLLNLSFWEYVIAIIILTQITIASVTIYLHRCQAHRALNLHPAISHFFRFWLWLTTGINTKAWIAIHRKHHAKCETNDDPHSPQILGIRKVLWQGAELYRKEAANHETLERYGQGAPDDWIEHHIYTRYTNVGLVLMLIIDVLLFGLPGITIWGLQMVWIPFFAAGVINGIGHYWGYRNYECPEAAHNIIPWGVIIGGEELHNNHHAFASSAKFSSMWWEFDIGWGFIKLLSWLHLAQVKKLPPKIITSPSKNSVDGETLKTLIVNRFNVLLCYTREVIQPILNEEKIHAHKMEHELFQKAHILLVREPKLIDKTDKRRLVLLLRRHKTLRRVYYYHKELQAIWKYSKINKREPLTELRDWCRRAENSGIINLKNFVQHLKTYTSR